MEAGAPDHIRHIEDASILEARQAIGSADDPSNSMNAGSSKTFRLHADERACAMANLGGRKGQGRDGTTRPRFFGVFGGGAALGAGAESESEVIRQTDLGLLKNLHDCNPVGFRQARVLLGPILAAENLPHSCVDRIARLIRQSVEGR